MTTTAVQETIEIIQATIAELERKYAQTGDFFTRMAIAEMQGKLAQVKAEVTK